MSAVRSSLFLSAALLAAPPFAAPAAAQNTGALAGKAERLQQDYVRGAVDLAGEFERAGDPGAAISLLRGVQKILPDAPGLQAKLDELEEDVLSAGETTLTIDAPLEWTPVAQVREGGVFRLGAAGTYRLSMSGTASVEGLPPGDATAGFVPDAPLGALIGAIVDPATVGKKGRRGQRLPEVFAVGGAGETTSKADGMLVVRLNVPTGSKAVGKLRVTLSGQVAPAGRR